MLSLQWLVVSFFAQSFAFQVAAALIDGVVRFQSKRRCFQRGSSSGRDHAGGGDDTTPAVSSSVASWLRFVEYSFSATVMIVTIALQVGIMDAWMLFALAALTWVRHRIGAHGGGPTTSSRMSPW